MSENQPFIFNRFHFVSLCVAIALLLTATLAHLLPALFAGCVIFILSDALSKNLIKGRVGVRGRALAALLVGGIFTALITLGLFYLFRSLRTGDDTLERLMIHGAALLKDLHHRLPSLLADFLPSSMDVLRVTTADYLKEHAGEVAHIGKDWAHALIVGLIGMVIGVLAAARHVLHGNDRHGPLGKVLLEDAHRFISVFSDVVFAQIKISLINTSLTAVYLLVALPLAGTPLPYAKTLVLITFLAGLLPIVGNLISNTVIVLISLGVGLELGLSSLIFLIVVHKLEYFINAKVMGHKVSASIVELLIAMLIAETLFGISGVIMAPLFYAFVKRTLVERGLL